MRNLEDIQESETPTIGFMGKGILWIALFGIGGAALFLLRPPAREQKLVIDPLADLIKPASSTVSKATLTAAEVQFPKILSDAPNPPAVYAATRTTDRPKDGVMLGAGNLAPPPPTDRLPVTQGMAPMVDRAVAISEARRMDPAQPRMETERRVEADHARTETRVPAREILDSTKLTQNPRDTLTKHAVEVAENQGGSLTDSGHDGGYQLQVSSFQTQSEAEAFRDQLRSRGHKSHVVEAKVPGRGTWYRVRVGPFATRQAATAYRASFEEKEHVVPFIVNPPSKK